MRLLIRMQSACRHRGRLTGPAFNTEYRIMGDEWRGLVVGRFELVDSGFSSFVMRWREDLAG